MLAILVLASGLMFCMATSPANRTFVMDQMIAAVFIHKKTGIYDVLLERK